MALSEIEQQRCTKALAWFLQRRRPPEHLRDELDIAYRLKGQSIEIFEVRPDWKDKTVKRETPVAKATFVRTKNCWKIYWMRGDLRWHSYDPSEVRSIDEVLAIVDRDEFCCFFG